MIEGLHSTVYHKTMPIPKLYYMMSSRKTFDLPSSERELWKLEVFESMIVCKRLIDLSCHNLSAVEHQPQNEYVSVPSYCSPLHYTNYYARKSHIYIYTSYTQQYKKILSYKTVSRIIEIALSVTLPQTILHSK